MKRATRERHVENDRLERETGDLAETRSLAGINFILGIWLIISPWVLNYFTAQARWDQFATGIAIAILSLIRYAAPRISWSSWFNGLAGIWMIIAPFVLNYSKSVTFWNEVIVGIVVAVLAFANAHSYARYRGTTV